ncbi:hypothetical protein Pla108_08660 [Botrimarina colliarenosi]|uniref:Methanolan biosynthesis EpsI domain-containing protein n=1 Tax=Botrimarina colliarenosi TaxID=2528001 RepID=A0A5C6AIN5_9BACT|nr:exosortase-associated EpsI family protein [Botrimarina colliarenosi]TWT99922.1 hypothetical protein Pla108_08660 [Botrimarina colliarenosi]
MSRIVPIVIAVVAIAALTFIEGRMSERWGDNRHCDYCATLLDDVPKKIGNWVGVDNEVGEREREVAGARGYVSRTYKNEASGQSVGIWFIVGHARDTFRHTPDICYGGSGFAMQGDQRAFHLDDPEADFWTAKFSRPSRTGGVEQQRVFWTWFRPQADSGEPVTWRVPGSMGDSATRYEFAAAPALFKLYFTTSGDAAEQEGDESVCMTFAREFLPTVEPLLAPANGAIPADFESP